MAGYRLSAEEAALWARVTATVRALAGEAASPVPTPACSGESRSPEPQAIRPKPLAPSPRRTPAPSKLRPVPPPPDTLDGGWDRRLARGIVAPDRTIDLHGHTLATAHAALDHALDRALADEARLLLVVTGRPPRPGDHQPRRGLIRAAIGDWLFTSPHASRIAAVRAAHPRHGGAGALYVILRRRREARA